MQDIILLKGKEKLPQRHHPWVFSKAFSAENLTPGVARVLNSNHEFIAWGIWEPKGRVPLHLLSWNEKRKVDDNWWKRTIAQALIRRESLFRDQENTSCFRIIFGEADSLPGVAADVLGTMVRVIISGHIAWEKRDLILSTIEEMVHPSLLVLTTDSSFTRAEEIPETLQFYKDGERYYPKGKMEPVRFKENGLFFEVIPGDGQKSGFYCDQRLNRAAVAAWCKGKTVLDAFSYTGAFTLNALKEGAESVDMLDSSESALRQALYQIHINENEHTIAENSRERVSHRSCNIFEEIRNIDQDKYDVIILDPPKLAHSQKELENAERAYKDLNMQAMKKIKHNGILATFSCSGALSRQRFQTVLAWAAQDAEVEIQILQNLGAGCDHPVRISFPESEYLKGFVLRVIKK